MTLDDDPILRKKLNKVVKDLENLSNKDLPELIQRYWKKVGPDVAKVFVKKNYRLWSKLWNQGIQTSYESGIKKTSYATAFKEPGIVRELADEYFDDHGMDLVKTLTESDMLKLKGQMKKNWGIGEDEFARKYKDSYTVSPERIKTIYRTEHHTAMNNAVLSVSKKLGREYKEWIVLNDERTCPICAQHIGDVVPIDKPFISINKKGEELEHDIPQSSHPQCRCTLITLRERDLTEEQKAKLIEKGYLEPEPESESTDGELWTPRSEYVSPIEEEYVPSIGEEFDVSENYLDLNERGQVKLNYKCPKGSHDEGFGCGGEKNSVDNQFTVDRVHRDNPGGYWLSREREYANEQYLKKGRNFAGSVSATFEGRLPTKMLASLPGVNKEHMNKDILHDFKAEPIRESIKNEGVKEPVMLYVGFNGNVAIAEGNHRVHLANEFGIKDVPVDIRYFAGGELAFGDFKLSNFEKETEQKYLDMEKQVTSENLDIEEEKPKVYDTEKMSDEEFFESIKNDKELAALKRKLILKGKVKSRVKLNYKCPKGTVDESNKCGEFKKSDVLEKFKSHDIKIGATDKKYGGNFIYKLDETGKISTSIVMSEDLFDESKLDDLIMGNKQWSESHLEPFTVASMFQNKGKYVEALCQHEIGHEKLFNHLVKQSENPVVNIEGMKPILSPRLVDAVENGDIKFRDIVKGMQESGWEPPSYYSKRDYGEMFAEFYCAYKCGFEDMCPPEVIEYIKEVESSD